MKDKKQIVHSFWKKLNYLSMEQIYDIFVNLSNIFEFTENHIENNHAHNKEVYVEDFKNMKKVRLTHPFNSFVLLNKNAKWVDRFEGLSHEERESNKLPFLIPNGFKIDRTLGIDPEIRYYTDVLLSTNQFQEMTNRWNSKKHEHESQGIYKLRFESKDPIQIDENIIKNLECVHYPEEYFCYPTCADDFEAIYSEEQLIGMGHPQHFSGFLLNLGIKPSMFVCLKEHSDNNIYHTTPIDKEETIEAIEKMLDNIYLENEDSETLSLLEKNLNSIIEIIQKEEK
ncbi:hypothetical protein VO56_00205 [Mycoplasmopsis gallinacea]|uniref:Uncharacterized protein n=1 Tax=Mycoplasmopsis gallinacea TaxID=29556 RepID=A0A0D5ZJ03_9BACT|nr:hypothetical protein VO56_00205 [Mycoplasmopsis gallinacea]